MIDYPSSVPRVERWGKRVRHAVQWLGLALRAGGVPVAVVVHPDAPSRRTALYKMCRALGVELTNRPRRRVLLTMRFEDATEKAAARPAWWPSGAWNDRCDDIRKSTLDRAHAQVFGYGVAVDPRAHSGRMLEKGDGNAVHDGREVVGPVDAPAQGKVYQIIVNNRSSDGRAVDLRLVFIRGQFPAVYLKYKPEDARYTNLTTSVELGSVQALFTPSELDSVSALMAALHVDYAELDVLRDADSGRMYVVDVNPTPWGPPAGLPAAASSEAVSAMAAALQSAAVSSK